VPSKKMIAAATRFKEAWDVESGHDGGGQPLRRLDVVELHEAALGLIWATGTTTLRDALDVLTEFDASPEGNPPPWVQQSR
jgi:hypothetical protein